MASGRVYRNYTLGDDSYEVSTRHSSNGKVKSQRSPKPSSSPSDERSSAEGLTSDDDGITPYEEESAESEFHESRVVFNPLDNVTALPSSPQERKLQLRTPTSRGSYSDAKLNLRDGYTSPSPASRSIAPPVHRTNYEQARLDEGRQQQQERQQPPSTPVSTKNGTGADADGPNKMPDFFSLAVFNVVLRNPAIAHQLLKFGQSRLCGEHMEFLAKVNKYHLLLHEVSKSISGIYEEFFADGAPKYVNIPQGVNETVNKEIRAAIASTLPKLETVFAPAQTDVERLIYGDIYPQFVRHQMSVSAAKALGSDRGKYAGLGDCFVLTDPTKADNPIVFASDGFVRVTGHPRKEIIPRNCRFLQSPQTDRAAVMRIKDAIDKREECVELLLNQKKNGEPFWNLLYTTPLFGPDGNLVFFLGGQINCSTTIHSTSDVLRILAQSSNAEEDSRVNTPAVRSPPGPSRTLRHPFVNNRASLQPRAPGMEGELVDRLGSMSLPSQFREFYNAYSNFLVINYSTLLIAFVSGGITDLLFPIKAKTAYQTLAVGTEIFKYLGNHSTGSISWEFKSSVKNALRAGQPVSMDLKLCAKPSMGFEKFVLHFTPLKNGSGQVSWIIMTLGNEQRA